MQHSFKRMLKSDLIRWDKAFIRKFFWIVIPIVVQNLVSSSLHIIDGVMIGRLGDVPYAAVTQANRFSYVYQLFLFGAGSGCGIYLSQYWGRKDIKAMHMVMGLCFRITLFMAFLFAGAGFFFTETMVGFFLPRGESFNYAVIYLKTVSVGYFVQAIDLTYSTCMKSSQKTHIPMTAGIIAIVVNTVLNYCLIYGKFGFPEMGVQGAALATVIAAAVGMTINIGCSYIMKLSSAVKLRAMKLPDWSFIKAFIKTAGLVVLNEGFWGLGITMYSVFYGRLGDAAVAAIGIYNTVNQLIHVLVYGVMSATAILVGSLLGAGKLKEANLAAKRMLFASVVVGIVMGLVLIVIKGPIVNFFYVSEEAKTLANQVLLVSSFFIWIHSFNTVNVVGVLRSGGDTLFSMLVDVGSVWIIGVPMVGIAALVLKLPLPYVFGMSFVEEFIKVFIAYPRFRSGKWMVDLTRSGKNKA